MHHEATACHVTGEIVELLSILADILRSFKPKNTAAGLQVFPANDIQINRIIAASKEWPEVLRKLATFLNTYNSGDLRNAAIGIRHKIISVCIFICDHSYSFTFPWCRLTILEALTEFLYIMPVDTLRTLVPPMVHCHSAYQDIQNSGMGPALGPYFPKRSPHCGITIKSTVRPPRPMLQMAIPHISRETSRIFKVCSTSSMFFS